MLIFKLILKDILCICVTVIVFRMELFDGVVNLLLFWGVLCGVCLFVCLGFWSLKTKKFFQLKCLTIWEI